MNIGNLYGKSTLGVMSRTAENLETYLDISTLSQPYSIYYFTNTGSNGTYILPSADIWDRKILIIKNLNNSVGSTALTPYYGISSLVINTHTGDFIISGNPITSSITSSILTAGQCIWLHSANNTWNIINYVDMSPGTLS